MNLTLMSLFDGSGGFPLAGAMHGIVPVYAAEVEPYPIAVTRSRFPNMRHLGSVTEINGAELEPVDVVTFGSPCQDLSVAGLQKGIHDGERSNLFFQAVRIIKELRDKDARTGRTNEHIRPRFAVWENVPGAYSSNGGHDFQAVLQALAEVADPDVSIPFPEKGKWTKAGCIVGDGWSIAWRTLDAQFWGVPQRRKRIYLVADFGSERAGEILFEREGVSGHSEPGTAQGQGTAEDSQGSAGGSGENVIKLMDAYQHHGWRENKTCGTLTTGQNNTIRGDSPLVVQAYSFDALASNSMKSSNPHSGCRQVEIAKTLDTSDCNPSKNQGGIAVVEPVAYTIDGRNAVLNTEKSGTLQAKPNGGFSHNFINPVVYDARGNGDGETRTCLTGDHQNRVSDYSCIVCYGGDKSGTLDASYYKGTGTRNGKEREFVAVRYPRKWIVRRLTPTECARLQGFPDMHGHPDHKDSLTDKEYAFWLNVRNTHAMINGRAQKQYTREQMLKWYNGLHTDSAEYKMWGNGIALPCAAFVLGQIARWAGDA